MSSERLRMRALATNPVEGASTRFRVEQWRSHLHEERIDLEIEPFYPSAASQVVYQDGHTMAKLGHFTRGAARRLEVLRRLPEIADILYVHREIFPLGWPLLLSRLERFPGAVIYDYDDALFVEQRRGRGLLGWLERLDAPSRLMRMSDIVLAGSPFLAEYARQYSDHVTLMPTCIDTERFRPSEAPISRDRCVVGWIGSHSTAKYLDSIIPALERVAESVSFELYVVGSPNPIPTRAFPVVRAPWKLEREVDDFQRCDIGIYPLWDDRWCRGKCGFKAIQFMSCGVPVIAAPVGVTRDIIDDGHSGVLASSAEEWAAALVRLISDSGLRRSLGQEGRRTIEQRYSLRAQAPTFTGAVREATARATARGAWRRSGRAAWSAK